MKKYIKPNYILLMISLVAAACSSDRNETQHLSVPGANKTTGSIEIFDSAAQSLIDSRAKISVRGEGYGWTEGPVWIEELGFLLYSDIPKNIVAKYHPHTGTSVYLEDSGATGLYPGDYKGGSNGLLLDKKGRLILLQQGDRRVAMLDAPLSSPEPSFITLVDNYQGKRLNSPNDGVYHSDGSLYFTDPPYGMPNGVDDERKELPFQGIYRLAADGTLTLLDDSVKYPNGIGLSIDEKTLYVAVSDEEKPVWLAYDLMLDGTVANKRIFYDASSLVGVEGEQGLPDGMAVHSTGNIFATGPGGVWLFTPEAKVLAKIRTGRLTANCTLSPDEKELFITAHDTLLSVPLN